MKNYIFSFTIVFVLLAWMFVSSGDLKTRIRPDLSKFILRLRLHMYVCNVHFNVNISKYARLQVKY